MNRFILICAAVCSLSFFSGCAMDAEDVDINGTWTLSTINDLPAALATINETLTISDSATYIRTGVVFVIPINESGSVAQKSDSVYVLTSSGGVAVDYTLDGNTLSRTETDDEGGASKYLFKKN